jgi:hypothetical protein
MVTGRRKNNNPSGDYAMTADYPRRFRPVTTGFDETYPQHYGGGLVAFVLRLVGSDETASVSRAPSPVPARHVHRWLSIAMLLRRSAGRALRYGARQSL